MPTRVLIVDQHEIMRAGIKLSCDQRDDLQFVGESNSLAEAVDVARSTQPDVAIVDPECDGSDGCDAINRLHQELPELKILAFSSSDGPDDAARILQAGASGFLIKVAGLDEIAVAIRSVHLGRIFISHSHPTAFCPKPSVSPGPVESNQQRIHPTTSRGASTQLSGREREVLSLLAEGMTNKQAAERLFLSVKTVETYRARIMKKHGLRDRVDLVQFARSNPPRPHEPPPRRLAEKT